MYWDRVPQSISDYLRDGEQYEPAYKTEIYEYNPKYITEYLPKGLELKKDDNGIIWFNENAKLQTMSLKRRPKYIPQKK